MSVSWEKQELAAILQPQEEFSDNPSINKNVKAAVQGLHPSIQRLFFKFPTEEDKELVADFVLS
jgi:hypothetical protein